MLFPGRHAVKALDARTSDLLESEFRSSNERRSEFTAKPGQKNRRHQALVLFGLFAAERLLIDAIGFPELLRLDYYVFGDPGSNLAIHHFVVAGMRPEIDFGYAYGLFPLLVGKLLFGILGEVPRAYVAANLIAQLLMCWALARIVKHLGLGLAGIVLAALLVPFGVRSEYSNLSHCVEAALFTNALAEQLAGRRNFALVLAVAAVFTKPALGYVFGLIVVCFVVASARPGTRARILQQLVPATITVVAMCIILTVAFGADPLLRTLLPLRGEENYRAAHFGFFGGMGSGFLRPPGVNWHFYVGTAAGLWAVASFLLILGTVLGLTRRSRGKSDELVVTTGVMHLAFVLLMFGNSWSWASYSYLLAIGLLGVAAMVPFVTVLPIVFCAIAAPYFVMTMKEALVSRSEFSLSKVPPSLWAPAEVIADWERAVRLSGGRSTVVLSEEGAAGLIAPEVEPPVAAFMCPGCALQADLNRVTSQVRSSEAIILPHYCGQQIAILVSYPVLNSALAGTVVAYKGNCIELRLRKK